MRIYRFEKYDVASRVFLEGQGIYDGRIDRFYEIEDASEYAVVKRIFQKNCAGSVAEQDCTNKEKVKEVLAVLYDADIISFRGLFRKKQIYETKMFLLLGRLFLHMFLMYHLAFVPFFMCCIIMELPLAQIFIYCEATILLLFFHECCHLMVYRLLCRNHNLFFSVSFSRIQLVTAPIGDKKSFLVAISGALGTILVCGLCLLIYFHWFLLLAMILNGIMLFPAFDDGKSMLNAFREIRNN